MFLTHCFELVIHIPRPLRRGAFLFPNPPADRHPRHPSPPTDRPKKTKGLSLYGIDPSTPLHTDYSLYGFRSIRPRRTLMRRRIPELNSSWIEGGGQPPRRPMTDINFPDRKGLIAPKKDPKFIAEKKPKFISKNFRRRNDRYFPNFFQKNLPKNKQLDSTGKQRNSS